MSKKQGTKNKANLELLRIYLAKQNEDKPKPSDKRTANNSR